MRATGYSLFHSFQTRQEKLAKSKDFWAWALTGCVLLAICLPIAVLSTFSGFDGLFFLKLSISLPIIYAISFCTLQYSRERKLEEEYAFKANISISLEPYKDLVDKIVDKGQPDERAKYATFIIESIGKVFTSPTNAVFDSKDEKNSLMPKNLKELGEFISKVKP